LLASASQDRTVRLWVPTYIGRTSDFKAHFSAVRSVHFSPDGENLVTGSDDKSVKLWSVEGTRRFLTSMTQHSNWVRCTRFNHTGSLVGSCADDCSAILWDVREPKKPVQMLEGLESAPNYFAFQPREETVFALAFSSGHVRIYDMRSPQHLLQKYNVSESPINQVAFHPTGHIMLASCANGEIKVILTINPQL
jgi:centriolar protein POC1